MTSMLSFSGGLRQVFRHLRHKNLQHKGLCQFPEHKRSAAHSGSQICMSEIETGGLRTVWGSSMGP
jgi:hypothetical protein